MFFFPQVALIAVIAAVAGFFFGKMTSRKGSGKSNSPIVNGIRDNALSFSEMYEPVYTVSSGKPAKQEELFASWNAAVAGCENEEFTKAFAEKFGDFEKWGRKRKGKGKLNTRKANKIYCKKARQLVKCFFKAGIIRERDVNIVADETTAEKFEIVGGAIEEGKTYDVLAPYWHLSDDVVDKGVIR